MEPMIISFKSTFLKNTKKNSDQYKKQASNDTYTFCVFSGTMAGPGMVTFTRTRKYSSSMAKELMEMKEDCFLSDFQITIDDKPIPCHKLMLAAHSPVIKGMFRSNMSEVAKQSMTLNHIRPEIMKILLDFMYSGQVTFHTDQLEGVIAACNYLQMTELQKMCIAEVPSTLEPNNAISWMQLGSQLDIADFKAQCEEIIAGHLAEISSHRDFLAMTHAEVKDCLSFVSKSETAHDDNDVLKAAMHWVSQDTEDRLTHLENLLQEIQLEKCSQEAVFDIMKTYETPIVGSTGVYKLLVEALHQITTKEFEILSLKSKAKAQELLVIIGGEVDAHVSRVCWHLDSSNQFVELCKIPFNHLSCSHSICATPVGFSITGGRNSGLCIMYNATTKSWSKLQDLRATRYGHASICINGLLFVFGGTIAGQISKSVDCLALKDGQWRDGPELPIAVYLPRVAQIKGIIYLLNLHGAQQLLKLDPESNTWVSQGSPPGGDFSFASMTSASNQLCIAGGIFHRCVWYNPSTNSGCIGQQPLTKHRYGTLIHHSNKIILLGGKTNDVEELCTETGTWSVSNIKLPVALANHQGLVLDIPLQE